MILQFYHTLYHGRQYNYFHYYLYHFYDQFFPHEFMDQNNGNNK